MRVIPKQKELEAFHFSDLEDFPGLLLFVSQGQEKIEGRVRVDGYKIEALVTLSNGNMKVNRHEWLIRNEEGVYRTISETEFNETYEHTAEKRTTLAAMGEMVKRTVADTTGEKP